MWADCSFEHEQRPHERERSVSTDQRFSSSLLLLVSPTKLPDWYSHDGSNVESGVWAESVDCASALEQVGPGVGGPVVVLGEGIARLARDRQAHALLLLVQGDVAGTAAAARNSRPGHSEIWVKAILAVAAFVLFYGVHVVHDGGGVRGGRGGRGRRRDARRETASFAAGLPFILFHLDFFNFVYFIIAAVLDPFRFLEQRGKVWTERRLRRGGRRR